MARKKKDTPEVNKPEEVTANIIGAGEVVCQQIPRHIQ